MPDEPDPDLPPDPLEGLGASDLPSDPSSGGFPGPGGDLLNDVPLLRELQRVLLASSGPVNWELARQIGIAMSAWDREDPPPTEPDRRGFVESVRLAELAVADLTGMPAPADLAAVEVVRRAGWVESNIRGLRELLEPVAARMTEAMSQAQLGDLPEMGDDQSRMLAGMMGQMSPLLLGAQVGMVLGYLAQRVLTQYDLAVPRSTSELAFVVPNIAAFERDWSLDPREFRTYLAVHEVAHRFEFGRPWVKDHFLGLVRDLVSHAEIDVSALTRQVEGLDPSNPEALAEAFDSLGNVFGSASTPEQRLRVARVRAFMSIVEAYGDHVTDAVARSMLPSQARIEEALVRHREGRHGDRAMERLMGLEMTEEHDALGRAFCERVVEQTSEATLSRVWGSADSMPSMPELEEPTLWLSRMA
jgi:putative hydrolase